MAEAPSLSEITNMTVDSERGSGTPAIIYDNRELNRMLNDNAQAKAQNDWRKYNLFLGNLKDVYKDINEIAKQPVLEEDMPGLRNEMAGIIKEIGSDPKSFFGGGSKYNEIQGKIAGLQAKATESKGNKLFDDAHRAFFYRNPDLETEENKALIENYRKQPLGSRAPYQLNLPGLVDLDALAKTLNNNVKKEEAYSVVTPDNRFFQEGKKTVYDPAKFEELARAAYEQEDARNIPIRKTMERRFNALPDYLKQQLKDQYKDQKDPVKAWFVDDLKKRMMPDSETKEALRANPNWLADAKLKLDQQEAANLNKYRMGQLAIDRDRLNFDKTKARSAGASQDMANSAKEYAVQLFGKLSKLTDANGVISAENMKKLTAEEKKYLGTATTVDNKFSISPLGDGYTISSMRITPEGMLEVTSVEGEGKDAVSNTLVIDPKQVAGNKLGDEMTLTTGKEGVNYNSLISLYGSGSASSGSGTYNIKGKDYTEKELLGMGYTIDQIKPYKK